MGKEIITATSSTANPINSMQVSASRQASAKRVSRNNAEADKLEAEGYAVERNMHPNGAYFAVIGNHPEHEKNVGRIFAENGISFTLDKEGKTIRINGRTYTIPSSDGRVGGLPPHGLSHEIYKFGGKPDARTVAEAIKHTYKPFRPNPSRSVQSEVAITITPAGSNYTREHIAAGVAEYKRQVAESETAAKPLLYLHADEGSKKIYRWDIK